MSKRRKASVRDELLALMMTAQKGTTMELYRFWFNMEDAFGDVFCSGVVEAWGYGEPDAINYAYDKLCFSREGDFASKIEIIGPCFSLTV